MERQRSHAPVEPRQAERLKISMNPERYALLQDLFMQVCNLPEAQRREILDEACRDDHALRDEVLALLDQDAPGAGRLETKGIGEAIWGGLAEVQSAEDRRPLPEKVGPYRILGEIGRGGMGRVLRAEQDSPKRTVALKMIFSQATSESQIRRFEHEAELLGRLRHPGIAQIYDAGTARTESGPQPYFAMEYVRGVPLLDYVRERGLSIEDRLRLLVRICDAVQHAHSKGVVHRDLKPANILVEPGGQPKVLDFGVARALDSDLRLTTAGTTFGKLIGTIPYMSPEQAGGDLDAIDTRSDVYALGVLLFELLGERLPHQLERKLPHEAVRVIRDEEPTRLGSVDRAFRGDLETIAAKALEKEPGRRYQTSADLAADLGSAREVVSRHLASFEERGLLRRGRGELWIDEAAAGAWTP